MQELFSYCDRTNEKDFVNSESPEGLPDDDSLCIVILGYSLSPYGEVRDELMTRLDAGIEVAEKYPNAYILVTGGGTALREPLPARRRNASLRGIPGGRPHRPQL